MEIFIFINYKEQPLKNNGHSSMKLSIFRYAAVRMKILHLDHISCKKKT